MLKSIPKKLKSDGSVSAIYGLEESGSLELPLFSARVAAGFPSPAEDHLESRLDLNQHLIRNPSSTFFVRAAGESMMEAGIYDQDLLIVDRSIEKRNHRVVIATLNVRVDSDFSIWGVVTHIIREV